MISFQTLCRLSRAALIANALFLCAGCDEPAATATTQPVPADSGAAVVAIASPDTAANTVAPAAPAAPSPAAAPASAATAPSAAPATQTTARAAVAPPAAAPRRSAASRVSPGGVRDVSFDDLKFEMQKGDPFLRSMLTPGIEALAGQRLKLRGYMLPSFQQSGIKQFVLVRDNMQCCFGPGAALYDCVVVTMAEGKTAEFSVYPVAVEGRFNIRELLGSDGKHLAIYEMLGDGVAAP